MSRLTIKSVEQINARHYLVDYNNMRVWKKPDAKQMPKSG